jgi:beta-glucanase (GH16 family)
MTHRSLLPALCALVLSSVGCTSPSGPGDWTLVWADEFTGEAGAAPDPANWRYDIGTDWGNAQLEFTTDRRENSALDGQGHLVITARREAFNGSPYTSARLTTAGKQEFTYGRFEARIKLPVGQGIWPAFWLLGANITEVSWPRSGEIDIMEFRGQEPTINHGSLHGPGYSGGNAITRRFVSDTPLNEDFHVYTVEWDLREIRWYVDGRIFHLVRRGDQRGDWVFNTPFYLILNIAVGGGFVGPVGPNTTFPQQMLVDWVRVYQRER